MDTAGHARVLPAPEAEIGAVALVGAPPAAVFAFLADLENHWRLTDRFVDVVDLAGPPGARHGGRVRIRGPLGLLRTAETQVVETSAPAWLRGTADMSGTTARVQWSLQPRHGSTEVRLEAAVLRARVLDRLLLALGGRWWLRRRFRATLGHLDLSIIPVNTEDRVDPEGAPTEPTVAARAARSRCVGGSGCAADARSVVRTSCPRPPERTRE